MDIVRLAELRAEALSVDEVRAAVAGPESGAIALFIGTVRNQDQGQPVSALSYSAHPSAAGQLRAVADRVAAAFDVHAVAAVHRTGDLAIGDLAVVVGVASSHRAEAIAACHALIDELKETVPIWKRQHFASGASEWVGAPTA